MKTFKGTKGELYIKHNHIHCDGNVIALNGSVKGNEESQEQLDGESWLSMRQRTKPFRESLIEEQKYNMKLMVASKELLKALQTAKDLIEVFVPMDILRREDTKILTNKISEAINKAL